jgi:hypothetical protein
VGAIALRATSPELAFTVVTTELGLDALAVPDSSSSPPPQAARKTSIPLTIKPRQNEPLIKLFTFRTTFPSIGYITKK